MEGKIGTQMSSDLSPLASEGFLHQAQTWCYIFNGELGGSWATIQVRASPGREIYVRRRRGAGWTPEQSELQRSLGKGVPVLDKDQLGRMTKHTTAPNSLISATRLCRGFSSISSTRQQCACSLWDDWVSLAAVGGYGIEGWAKHPCSKKMVQS